MAITDANGTVLEKRLFDAWGSIAQVQDGAGNVLNVLTILDRGYTGHEPPLPHESFRLVFIQTTTLTSCSFVINKKKRSVIVRK